MSAAKRAKKKLERNLNRSQDLLERIAQDPGQVLETLNPSEVQEMRERLDLLAERTSEARKGSDLQHLSEEILGLLEDVPALGERFTVTRYRSGTQEDLDIMLSEDQVMSYAAQLDNSVADLREAIERQFERLTGETRDDVNP